MLGLLTSIIGTSRARKDVEMQTVQCTSRNFSRCVRVCGPAGAFEEMSSPVKRANTNDPCNPKGNPAAEAVTTMSRPETGQCVETGTGAGIVSTEI